MTKALVALTAGLTFVVGGSLIARHGDHHDGGKFDQSQCTGPISDQPIGCVP